VSRWTAVAGLLACFLVGVALPGARAQTIDTQAGNPLSDGGTFAQLIGLQTASGDKKAAIIVIQGPEPTKDEYKPRWAGFPDKAHWDQFAALWNQARGTKPPARTNINGDSTKIGQYWDDAGQVLLTVEVNDDATIEINVMGPDKWPMMFRLQPKDFDEFGRNVATVTAYFTQ
jgi:hypothetical protein